MSESRRIHVFGGPSVNFSDAFWSSGLICMHRPAVKGSLVGVLDGCGSGEREGEPLSVLLIDGEFGAAQALNLTEIREFLATGAHLYGSTSIGALRAVEARNVGMIGLGSIFVDYLEGRRVRDADVAVPTRDDGTALGPSVCDLEALPSVLWTLHKIQLPRAFVSQATSTYYLDRTYTWLADVLRMHGVPTHVVDSMLVGDARELWAIKAADAKQSAKRLLAGSVTESSNYDMPSPPQLAALGL